MPAQQQAVDVVRQHSFAITGHRVSEIVSMTNKFYKGVFWLISSLAISTVVFLLLVFTGLAKKFVDLTLKISGNDFWQGETRSPYMFNGILLLATLIFILTLVALRRQFFKSRQ